MSNRINKEGINLRFNILSVFVYIAGIILIIQLFNLQIIHGAEYRENSNTRLSRESTLEAARGSILDRSGTVFASTKMGFNIELYKTKSSNDELNNCILNLTNLLEEKGYSYPNNFPINCDTFEFKINDETLKKWKTKYKIDENATAEDVFYVFKDKYEIKSDNKDEIKKIIAIRYEITTKGYSSTKSLNIATDVSDEVVAVLSEKNDDFPGITIVTEPIRTYNLGTLASHIVGYTGKINEDEYNAQKDIYNNDDIVGRTGIESVFEKYLKGTNGTKQIDMSVDGTTTAEYTTEEAIAGADVVLTIDADLQKVTEDSLKETISKISSGGFSQRYDAQAGSAVVMNVKTGEVLSMVSYPDYNPEDFVGGISNEKYNTYKDGNALYNRAISGTYAPGSTFKMVTALAALGSGAITTTEKVNDVGIYAYSNDYQPKCWYYTSYHRGHGYLNIREALQKSCNYFFYEVANRMGIDTLVKYAKYFGLGTKTGIELPSETAGILASKEAKAQISSESWQGGETLSSAIGQSYNSFSPLQMAKYVSMIANGGNKLSPTIVKTVRNADGTEVSSEEIKNYVNQKLGLTEDTSDNSEVNITPEYLQAVLDGMKSVTDDTGGTAYNVFKNFSITVGGKTGSAEAGTKVNAWFVAFAPFENPEIAIVVMIENGGHGMYAAEAARNIISEYFGMNTEEVTEDMSAIPYTEQIR